MKTKELEEILSKHKKWVVGEDGGERADLQRANLDFSGFPLWCGSFDIKVDDRLVLQLFAHIARLDISGCSKNVKTLVGNLPELAKNRFCKYRSDVEAI